MNFREYFSQKKNSFAISEKNFSRDCSLHTQRLTQRKPLSWTFCSTLTCTLTFAYRNTVRRQTHHIGSRLSGHVKWYQLITIWFYAIHYQFMQHNNVIEHITSCIMPYTFRKHCMHLYLLYSKLWVWNKIILSFIACGICMTWPYDMYNYISFIQYSIYNYHIIYIYMVPYPLPS